jgi:hypothetical protein
MKHTTVTSVLLLLIFTLSCTYEEVTKIPQQEIAVITLNFEPQEVLDQQLIIINIQDEISIDSLAIYIDGELKQTLTSRPFEYDFDGTLYDDGEHEFKVVAFVTGQTSISKTTSFTTDYNGPVVIDFGFIPNQVICDEIDIEPIIEGVVTPVKQVQFFINDQFVSEMEASSNFTFNINPALYPEGEAVVKFQMEDIVGNQSIETSTVYFGSALVSVSLPDEFTRASVEKLYVMLSDADGNYVDSKIYNDQPEILEFCGNDITPEDEYMLTFFEVFEGSIYNIFCYSNLSQNKIGDQIVMKPRPLTNSFAAIDLDTSNLNLTGNVKASGQGYSMVTINNFLSGTLTTEYANNLGPDNTMIKAYNNQSSSNDYKWAFINNLQSVGNLKASDFSNDNVVTNLVSTNVGFTDQFLRLYGYENTELMNVLSGHDLYDSRMKPSQGNQYKYQYADIFEEYFYSLRVGQYYKDGLGLPPQSLSDPNFSIDFSLNGNVINFQGQPNYEVGKIRLTNDGQGSSTSGNPRVVVEFIFDGSKNQVIIPKVPEGMFDSNIYELFQNADFTPIQAIAENYSSFDNYEDYLQNVFINSNPFYLSSSSRERVYKSFVSPHILPVFEYPYFTRF